MLSGGDGEDYLDGGAGADVMAGGAGNDTYVVSSIFDAVQESAGGGFDRVYADFSYTLTEGADVELLAASGTAALDLNGNSAGNHIQGNDAINALGGGAGDDVLFGLGGNDALSGGAGNDRLEGGLDLDTLTGNTGADTFVFNTPVASGNADRITDFAPGEDKMELSSARFEGLAPGPLAAGAFHAGTAAADADDRIVYDAATGALFFDADGNGAIVAVQFAILTGSPAITAGNFLIA